MAEEIEKEDPISSGLLPWATMTAEEVWQPLLSAALQEFDHRVDLTRHGKLMDQIQVTALISAERVTQAVQQEMRSAGRMSDTLESGRELATVAYDLAAFTDSKGPYTLYEIYQTFSFCDKIQLIGDYATQEFRRRLQVPELPETDENEIHAGDADAEATDAELEELEVKDEEKDEEKDEKDDKDRKEKDEKERKERKEKEKEDEKEKDEEKDEKNKAPAAPATERSRWRPPDPAETKLFLRAGLQVGDADLTGLTPLAQLCEAACLCAADEEVAYRFGQPDVAQPQDKACAETVHFLCEEAPAIWSAQDKIGRTPLVIVAEAFGMDTEITHGVPLATLLMLLESLDFCFSKSPSTLLLGLRYCPRLRAAAEYFSRLFLQEGISHLQLDRLLSWTEVIMGGAWEVSEEQRCADRVLMEAGTMDVEDMVNTAIRLRNFSEQMEKKVAEWEAEEAELKVIDFEARCARKARQYEDRIARLEAEIARRAGSLQLLPQPPQSAPEEKEKDNEASEAVKVVKPPAPVQKCHLEEAKHVVEEIRTDRLVTSGWDEGISEEQKEGLLSMRRSLCAAVERLAMDLYADECHCLWELMQNADDNKYASDELPELTLALKVEEERAYVWTSNNELGLSPEDVRAICNVNASQKGAGQTGHKGIGWKSVFRISDCPHVLSNAFAFKFDTQGPLGRLALVTPTNLSEEDIAALPAPVREAKAAGNTVMFLPLRSKSDALAVEVELRHIAAQHLCLAFLRRLRRIRLCFTEGSMLLQRAEADVAKLYFPEASNMVAVKITEFTEAGESRAQTPEYVMHHHEVALQGETAELTLAFPVAFALDTSQASEEDEELLKAPLQPLFTFLPVKVVGFRFAIQGPFDLTADRANLHGKSLRNRSLCASVPMAFQAALQKLPGLRSRALDLLGQETPEATWLLVRGQLLEALRDVECIPTEPDGNLARPGECLLPPEESLTEMNLPPEVLWDRCGRRLVQRPWASRHRAQTQGLNLEELGIKHWLQVLQVDEEVLQRSFVEDAAQKQDHVFFKRLLSLLSSTLSDKTEVLEKLKRVPLLPDARGNALRIADGPTFSSYAADVPKSWQKHLEAAGAMRVLCDKVHAVLDTSSQKFLRQLGVTRPSRQDLVELCLGWHASLAERLKESGGTAEPRSDEAKGLPGLSSETLRSAAWASLASLRHHFLSGSPPEVPWSELDLLVPSTVRSGFGPVKRLTTPSFLGESGELQQDVLVAIMSFIYGTEADVRDIGVFADSPPAWLQEEKEKDSKDKAEGKAEDKAENAVADKLNWEVFFHALGMKPLSPCTLHRKVAGTVLSIHLGWRLSSCEWWRGVRASKAMSYVEQRLFTADRVEISWLRQLRTAQGVDVSELFLRSNWLRYGGHFLPYMDSVETGCLGCLERLNISTELSGAGLRKCLRVLQKRCHDISVYADVYAALQALPKAEQSSTKSWGEEDPGQFQVFIPPDRFEPASRCIWTDQCSCLRWLCGYHVLQQEYGRFGAGCRSWLLGPHVGVQQDLNGLQASDFLAALRSLVEQADVASRIPVEERHKRMGGRDSPSAAVFLEELQSTAVDAYKQLARCCVSPNAEERGRANGAIALAFQHEALIVLTDKDWPKPKRLKSHEAFWDVHPSLASSKAAKLAMKGRLPSEHLDVLRKFFVEAVGIAESLNQQDLEARLRVPLSQEPPPPSSWQDGFGLQDFEDFTTLRRGPGVLAPGAGEEEFFQSVPEAEGEGDAAPRASSGSQGYGPAVPGGSAGAPSAASAAGASAAPTHEATRPATERPSEDAGHPEVPATSHGTTPATPPVAAAPDAKQSEEMPDVEEPEEEDDFDWDSEDVNDPYKVLRVEKDADEETVKRAYKKLALKYHPDKNRGSDAQERFQAIASAYETLRDPEKRKSYDEAAAAHEHAKQQARARERVQEAKPEPRWEANVSVEEAREMFQNFCGGESPKTQRDPSNSARPTPSRPAQRAQAAGSSSSHSQAAPASSTQEPGKKTRTLSKEEYNELMRQLKEAEEEANMWNEEVEAARQQLSEAEETRDRYLRILQECYDRTSRN